MPPDARESALDKLDDILLKTGQAMSTDFCHGMVLMNNDIQTLHRNIAKLETKIKEPVGRASSPKASIRLSLGTRQGAPRLAPKTPKIDAVDESGGAEKIMGSDLGTAVAEKAAQQEAWAQSVRVTFEVQRQYLKSLRQDIDQINASLCGKLQNIERKDVLTPESIDDQKLCQKNIAGETQKPAAELDEVSTSDVTLAEVPTPGVNETFMDETRKHIARLDKELLSLKTLIGSASQIDELSRIVLSLDETRKQASFFDQEIKTMKLQSASAHTAMTLKLTSDLKAMRREIETAKGKKAENDTQTLNTNLEAASIRPPSPESKVKLQAASIRPPSPESTVKLQASSILSPEALRVWNQLCSPSASPQMEERVESDVNSMPSLVPCALNSSAPSIKPPEMQTVSSHQGPDANSLKSMAASASRRLQRASSLGSRAESSGSNTPRGMSFSRGKRSPFLSLSRGQPS